LNWKEQSVNCKIFYFIRSTREQERISPFAHLSFVVVITTQY
jgi:hypothetical protein